MDSRLIFHEGRWVSVKLCDNAYFKDHGYGIGVSPQCLDGLAEVRVEIHYDELEKASCYLCRECLRALKKSGKALWLQDNLGACTVNTSLSESVQCSKGVRDGI